MTPSLTDILCTRCGLCCNGSLFADVELAGPDEVSALEVLGLEVEDADESHRGLLLQPCRALKGTRCSIYPHRPECCRTFECRLLQQVGRGTVGVDRAQQKITDALERVAHIRELLATLGRGDEDLPLKERCQDALAMTDEVGVDRESHRKRNELARAMTSLERVIRETFLGRVTQR